MIIDERHLQIKLQHKKSSYEEKYLQSQKNNLPAKLLYNVEYIGDFIELQLSLEQLHQLSSNFLRKGINRHQRKLVVSYLIKVTAYSKYPSFILYQAVKILDNMLDKKWIDVNELQIMGLTALWITLKRIHTTADIPSATDILYFCKGEYTPEDLFNCELNIMGTLKCELSFIDPFSILAYLFIHINNPFLEVKHTDQMYYCASYLIDVSLLSSTLCKGSTILLIMAAAELALFVILAKADELKNPNWNFWRHSLPNIYNDGRNLNEAEIEMTRKNLIKLALLSKNLSEDYFSVYEKYKRSRYGCISEIMIGRLLKVSQSSCKHSETAS